MPSRRITFDSRTLERARFASRRILEAEVMGDEADVQAYEDGVATAHLSRMDNTFVRAAMRQASEEARVLDVGTGTGSLPVKIASKREGICVVGVDLSSAMLRVARQGARRVGLQRRVTFRKANARRLPFPAGAFDLVVSNSLLHHLPDPVPTFNEIARVLAPRGKVFIRDLRRPGPSRMNAHIRKHGRFYKGTMYRLFADSVRASFKVSEMAELVGESDLRGCRVRPQFATYLVIEGSPGRSRRSG